MAAKPLLCLATVAVGFVLALSQSCPSLECTWSDSDERDERLSKCREQLFMRNDSASFQPPNPNNSTSRNHSGAYVHYYSSRPEVASGRTASDITGLLMVLHGLASNAGDYFYELTQVVQSAGACNTAVLAPELETNASRLKKYPRSHTLMYWKVATSFINGEASVNEPSTFSFDVLDRLLLQAFQAFPALATVTVTGHSAGAQALQRWAGATNVTTNNGRPIRIILNNSGTYLYLNSQRLSAAALAALNSTCGLDSPDCVLPNASRWASPYTGNSEQGGTGNGCSATYDQGKYGLSNLNGSYLARAGAAYINATYPTRYITYLMGSNDTLPNYHLDRHCAADAQGFFRRQRGEIFAQYYLPQFYPATKATQSWMLVPGCGHNETCMFESPQFNSTWLGSSNSA